MTAATTGTRPLLTRALTRALAPVLVAGLVATSAMLGTPPAAAVSAVSLTASARQTSATMVTTSVSVTARLPQTPAGTASVNVTLDPFGSPASTGSNIVRLLTLRWSTSAGAYVGSLALTAPTTGTVTISARGITTVTTTVALPATGVSGWRSGLRTVDVRTSVAHDLTIAPAYGRTALVQRAVNGAWTTEQTFRTANAASARLRIGTPAREPGNVNRWRLYVPATTRAGRALTAELTEQATATAPAERWRIDIPTGPIRPAPTRASAEADIPRAYADGCQQGASSARVITCRYGDVGAATTVALVGDSKVLQWLPAFDDLGQQHGWRVVTVTKSGCAFASGLQESFGAPYLACTEWNTGAMATVLALAPDLVVTSQYSSQAFGGQGQLRTSAMVTGLVQHWTRLQDAGIPVVALLNNPSPPTGRQVYDCVAARPTLLSDCAFTPQLPTASVQRAAAAAVPGVGVLDLNDALCPDRCPAVLDDVLVYRRGSHLTVTAVGVLTPLLGQRLLALPAAGGLLDGG